MDDKPLYIMKINCDAKNLAPKALYLIRLRKYPWPRLVTWNPEFKVFIMIIYIGDINLQNS